jgi:hypothetical protein
MPLDDISFLSRDPIVRIAQCALERWAMFGFAIPDFDGPG